MFSWADITPRKEKKRGRKQILHDKERTIVNKVTHGPDDRHCVFRHKCELKVQNKKMWFNFSY
jgi:hypothetical protein